MVFMNTYSATDEALDYAEMNRNAIPFCGKMWRLYVATGHLTQNQIKALLKIKEERR